MQREPQQGAVLFIHRLIAVQIGYSDLMVDGQDCLAGN